MSTHRLNRVNNHNGLHLLLSRSRGANSRKKILKTLLLGTCNCNQITTKLGLNWRTTYHHLQLLEKANLIKSINFGQRKFYKLTQKGEVIAQQNAKNHNVI
ncbi:MAG: hypothetical protein CW716_10530 [Candidatus Bathyarchaeum sp.]|nr:MAG: hypothetical protein CW716_10530 [Candidatus Bathyarchaeum sp.]